MRAYTSDASIRHKVNPDGCAEAAPLAFREASLILAETEPRDPGTTEHCRLDDVRYFRRKARKSAETRSLFADQHSAHAALAEALAAFVAEGE